jgi:hypothetical protein
MELLWQRNAPGIEGKPGDQQGAYDGGYKFVEMTRRLMSDPKVPQAEKDAWSEVEELVKEYEAMPGIKSVAQQKKEAEEAR